MSEAQITGAAILAALSYAGWAAYWMTEAFDRHWHGGIAFAMCLGPLMLAALCAVIFG